MTKNAQIKVFPTFRFTVHEGNNYQCVQCGKIFYRHKNLKRHVVEVHEKKDVESLTEDERNKVQPQCEMCGKSISQKHLKRHMETVHSQENNKEER